MSRSITRADIEGCRFEFAAHIDARDWFGEVHRCIEHPRLQRITRAPRRGKSPKNIDPVSWLVDGKPVANLDEAVVRLNEPAELTPDEREALAQVTDEYVDLRKEVEYRLLSALTDKGVIEFRDGKCRRRIEGRGR